jgi:hypothetical protein
VPPSRTSTKGRIELHWHPPLRVREARDGPLMYTVGELTQLPDGPGLYVFAHRRGSRIRPLYIGIATRSVRNRIKQQLNSVRLMKGIQDAVRGGRVLLVAELAGRRNPRRVLPSLEHAMIRYALAEGHEILNKSGTRIRAYDLRHRGNRESHSWMPLRMEAEQLKRRRPRATA